MLSTKKQQQIIADLLADFPVKATSTYFDKTYRAIFKRLVNAPIDKRLDTLEEIATGLPEGIKLVTDILSLKPGTKDKITTLADINPRPIEWLWPGWLVKGEINLLAAEPSAGKSLVSLDWAYRVINHQPMPDGFMPEQGKVVYVDAEGRAAVMKERAKWWGFDQTQLIPLWPREHDICVDLNSPSYQDELTNLVFEVDPKLVIIDSFSTISTRGENSKEDVQGILGYIKNLAQTFQTTILLIHHLNKREGGRMFKLLTLDDIRGSTHIGAVPLSIIGLSIIIEDAENPNRNGPRRLDVLKANVSKYHDPIGVNIIPTPENGGVMVDYSKDAPMPAVVKIDEDTEGRKKMVFDAIKELGKEATVTKISNLTFLAKGVVSRYCTTLKEEGIIDREEGFNKHWFIVDSLDSLNES